MLTRFLLVSSAALAAALGWYQLFSFSATPGEQSAAPAQWPRDIVMPAPTPAADGRNSPLLLVFIHPQCSCTHATLAQLDRVLSTSHASARIALVVYRSKTLEALDNRNKAAVRRSAPGRQPLLPGFDATGLLHRPFEVLYDRDGALARRFGAATSGEIVLYAASGHLLFQGGITPERFHVGDSTGGDSLRLALTTGAVQTKPSTVFGCPIFHLAASSTSKEDHAG